jgi:hypothetical protein
MLLAVWPHRGDPLADDVQAVLNTPTQITGYRDTERFCGVQKRSIESLLYKLHKHPYSIIGSTDA